MSEQTCGQQTPEVLLDAKVVAAYSSLTVFSCEFSNGKGLILEAVGQEGTASVQASVVDSDALPRDADAVCKVDWTWIYGSALERIVTTSGAARLELKDIGPLTIAAQVWQGKPFLSFQPFRAAK